MVRSRNLPERYKFHINCERLRPIYQDVRGVARDEDVQASDYVSSNNLRPRLWMVYVLLERFRLGGFIRNLSKIDESLFLGGDR